MTLSVFTYSSENNAIIILQTAFLWANLHTFKGHTLVNLQPRLEGINFQLGKVSFLSTVFLLNI